MKRLVILFLITFFMMQNVAAFSFCSNEEKAKYNSLSNELNVNYSIEEGVMDTSEYVLPAGEDETSSEELKYVYLRLNILNFSEYFEIELVNQDDDSVVTVKPEQATNGVYQLDLKDVNNVVNYKISVYTSKNTSCYGELIKTINFTVPRYNRFSALGVCYENDSYYCQQFVTFADMDYDDFIKLVDKKNEGSSVVEADDVEENTKEENKTNYVVWLIAGASILITTIVVIVLIRRKNGKKF